MKNIYNIAILILNYIGLLLTPFNSYVLKKIGYYIYTGRYKFKFKEFGINSVIVPKFRNIVGEECISIGSNTSIGKLVTLTAWKNHDSQLFSPSIKIGDNTQIGDFSHITAISNITIGNNVLMGKNILITDNSHGLVIRDEISTPPLDRDLYSKGDVFISDNVWIGEKSTILPNVRIGYGAVIAANSVVTKDIDPYSVVGGNPAKLIKRL